jgi:plastocyanin
VRRFNPHRPIACASVLAAVLLLGACGGGSGAGSSPANVAAEVTITDATFAPAEVGVTVGRAVQWTNTSATERHNILPVVEGSFAKHDTLIKNGEKVTITFQKVGDYAYYCSIHGSPTSGQRGVVHVTAIN